MEINAFGYALGLLLFTATLAAIMSTADSLLIAISQLLTVEVARPLWPAATPRQASGPWGLASLPHGCRGRGCHVAIEHL